MVGLIFHSITSSLHSLWNIQPFGIPLIIIIPAMKFRRQIGGFLARRTGTVR